VGALVVSGCVLATVGHVLYHHLGRLELRRPSLLLLALLATQITLGGLTVLSGKHYVINSLHVVTGALALGTSLVLTLRTCRSRFAVTGSSAAGPDARHESNRPLRRPRPAQSKPRPVGTQQMRHRHIAWPTSSRWPNRG
jgi:uncharacterized membrane protein